MGPNAVDQIQLHFDPRGLMVVNVAIGLMMLGVALDLRIEDFKRVVRAPGSLAIGLVAQFLLLPAFTFLVVIVAVALARDWNNFVHVIGLVAFAVFLHNALALSLGYFSARLFGRPEADRRAISIEVGIQNSGLGLVLVFNFFAGLGGMAVVVAWWGIWHIIAGLTVAGWFSRRPIASPAG